MEPSVDTAALMTHSVILSNEFDEIAEHYDPPTQALTEMVRRVANRLELDVCSVYILESDRQHLSLAATMGLNQDSVGHIRMQIREGLAGLAAEQLAPVSVAAASEHPRFKYFPDAGEERYSSFLGLPVMNCGLLQGVLVVQTIEVRTFTDAEFALIAATAGALAPHVTRCRQLEFEETELEPLQA